MAQYGKHADSLLENYTNNLCEQFNSKINKFISSKRINHGQKGGYITRVEAAVISFNTKKYLCMSLKALSDTNANPGKSTS